MQIVTLTAFFGFIFILSFFGWKKLWFDRFGGKFLLHSNFYIAEMPVFKNTADLDTRMYARTKTLSIFWSMFSSVLTSLDQEYWVTHCGVDGYLYLLF